MTGCPAGEKTGMWTRMASLTEGIKLSAYERIVKYYLRYVLLRCCEYTNNRCEAEQIAAYTLMTTCSLLEQLRHAGELGWLLDRMVEVIAEERSGLGRVNGGAQTCGSSRLLSDGKVRRVADCVNRLDRLGRQVLVLGLIEKMSVKTISEIYGKSVEEIILARDIAEIEMAECLCRSGAGECIEDLSVLMRGLGQSLEPRSRRCITKAVLCYLVEDEKENCRVAGLFRQEELN